MSSEAVGETGTAVGAPATHEPEYLRLVVGAALIGIPAALVAALFLAFIHDLQHWLWTALPSHLGTLFAAVVPRARNSRRRGGDRPCRAEAASGRRRPRSDRRHQRDSNAALVRPRGGARRDRHARVRRGARARGTLIALGSVVAFAFARLLRAPPRTQPQLAIAGSFSAISALFGGPIVGGVMMVEAALRRSVRRSPRRSFRASWRPPSATRSSSASAAGAASAFRASRCRDCPPTRAPTSMT